ncbi:hypothetical protein LOD44_05130 [Xylella fastidiosa subsp. multiplex]|nr:hypothetical protein [Xylella fastidiosa]MBE0268750.1 hypothetical protein [Xylella fastidiosa subsp. multiplex]MBE0275464.1 hypothetical protein [Xylella fastidiosa subsp. multiplex]MDC6411238.1 hypothetical protein [Xylella fastidiosa subsp. multiplex]MDC6417828.1 hypothetical protein [Xylella fastidiosa subsp. multiplex]MDD0863316.1 hypothetical protein [Xylella fastidiosa subsp. multiplex]
MAENLLNERYSRTEYPPPAPAPYKGQEESHLIALQYCGMKIHDLLTKHA